MNAHYFQFIANILWKKKTQQMNMQGFLLQIV